MNSRINEIDIVKALAIILVVCGHAGAPFSHFLYLFHVAVFFIASGFVFNDSDSDSVKNVLTAITKKIEHIWLPYFLYSTVFTLFHNVFIKINVYTDNEAIWSYVNNTYTTVTEPYSVLRIIKQIVLGFVFQNGTILGGGGFWFLMILFFLCVFFVIIDFLVKQLISNDRIRDFTQIMISIVFLGFGSFFQNRSLFFLTRVGSCYCLYLGGHLLANHKEKLDWDTRESIVVVILAFSFLVIMNQFCTIDLGLNSYGNPICMLLCSFSGWFLLYGLSRIIVKFEWLKCILQFVGQRTISILSLHFLCFKTVAFVVAVYYGLPLFCIAAHPNLYGDYHMWWILYLFVGIVLPLCIDCLIRRIKLLVPKRLKDLRSIFL